ISVNLGQMLKRPSEVLAEKKRTIDSLKFALSLQLLPEQACKKEIKKLQKQKKVSSLQFFSEAFAKIHTRILAFAKMNPGPFSMFGDILCLGFGGGHVVFLARMNDDTFTLYDSNKAQFYNGSLNKVLSKCLLNVAQDLTKVMTTIYSVSEFRMQILKRHFLVDIGFNPIILQTNLLTSEPSIKNASEW